MSLLDRVGMSDRVNALPRQLSGGQQQRVAIARALAMQPQAILFDEPTSALDPRMTAEVLAVISDLAGDGLTMIVVTHAMQFARRVAHTVHVFDEGKVIESGPPAQIFDDPQHEATRKLLSALAGGVTGAGSGSFHALGILDRIFLAVLDEVPGNFDSPRLTGGPAT